VALRLRITQGHDFGVRPTSALGVALADNLTVGCSDDAAHARVGGGEQQALRR